MDLERLITSVVSGAVGGRRKRHRGAMRFLTAGKRSFLNASTLLTLAGVAWGVWEAANRPTGPQPVGAPTPPGSPPISPPPGASAVGARTTPPPLPGAAAGAVVPPPLPTTPPAPVTERQVPPEVLRVLRLTLSAARADGTLTPHEREALLGQARAVGAEEMIASELERSRPLGEVVGDVANPRVREDLYTLCYAIVRADESVTPAERTYLSELAGHLRLDAETVARLEDQAAARIQEAAEGVER